MNTSIANNRLPGRMVRLPGRIVEALLLATLLFSTFAVALAPSVDAVAAPPIATVITAEVPTGSILGKNVVVGAILKDRAGNRLAGEHLALFIEGVQLQSQSTDAQGLASFAILGKRLDQARAYRLTVVFSGSHGFAASTVNVNLTILAAAIQIQTVPPLPGMRFTLGTISALTGPDGVAALPVPQAGSYSLAADLNPSTSADATVKAGFVRWLDNVFTANRTIDVTGPATYTIGLTVAYRANIRYVDLNNQPVDSSLVSQAQFSTGTGANDVVLNSQTKLTDVWWTAATTIRAGTLLLPSPITYRVLSVKMHGADVVNRGQQSWTPTQNGTWTVQVLLYGLTVQTQDALLGGAVSGKIQLTYPNGDITTKSVGGDGSVAFDSLPRGEYKLSLGSSLTPPTQVTLSRPQSATLRVITYVDIGLVLGFGLAIVVMLVIIGRWSLVTRRIRRKRDNLAVSTPADLSRPTA
jgi:hypothetical protein